MADFLEYSDVSSEIKGSLTPGKLKMTDQHIIFKNSKTGKVDQISSSDFEAVNFQNFAGTWGIRVFLKNGTLHRYVGFRESEKEKIAKFFKNSYKIDMLEKELSLKGWNWGTAKFNGAVLSFDINDKTAFEIPLNHVSQCTGGKNEITMEFHQNDDAPVSLLEMRFFIPSTENAETDPVEAFQQQVMDKASVISVSGDAIAIFREIHCLTPRGRYDIKMFSSFFQLHGKTFDYKIPMSTVLRLFILPHKDGRQTFFVVSLDPPIKQGQTRYHFLVFLFQQEDNETLELPFTEEELKDKFEGKLEKEISGPTYEVLGRVMKNIANRKLTGPGGFIGHSGTPAVGCSFKAAAGYLYPLERGFMYVHKPPLHIRFEEIASVNFARGGGSTRSFDFEIELKSGTVHTFSSIEKEEYGKLFDFITSKKLNIKNRGKSDKNSYNDDFGNSDDEAAPDAYLERVKAEGQEKDSDDDDEDESTDEDFDPTSAKGGRDSDIAEEYDSNPTTSESDEDGEGGSGDEKKSKKKEKKHKSAKTVSEKPRKRKEKKDKDENQPKRPSTAFMMWLNATREQIKKDNPGIKVTEIAKKGGEMWRELKDKSEWEKKAAKEKEEYNKAMEEYRASGGGEKSTGSSKSAKKSKPSKKPSSPEKSGSFKSREFVEDSDSSDDEGETKKKEVKKPAKKDVKKKKSDSSGSEADDEKPKKKEAKKPAKKEDKKKKSDSEKSEAESELEDEDKGKKRKKESDDEKSKKKTKKGGDKAAKSKKKESGSENDEDEEEILSTPPSSGASDESD